MLIHFIFYIFLITATQNYNYSGGLKSQYLVEIQNFIQIVKSRFQETKNNLYKIFDRYLELYGDNETPARHISEADIKLPIFGSSCYNPMTQEFMPIVKPNITNDKKEVKVDSNLTPSPAPEETQAPRSAVTVLGDEEKVQDFRASLFETSTVDPNVLK